MKDEDEDEEDFAHENRSQNIHGCIMLCKPGVSLNIDYLTSCEHSPPRRFVFHDLTHSTSAPLRLCVNSLAGLFSRQPISPSASDERCLMFHHE